MPTLARALRALRPEALEGVDEAALDACLVRRFAAARARWPAVRLDDEALLAALARHLPATFALLESLQFDDLFLAAACAAGDRAAIALLDASLLVQAPRWLAKIDGVAVEEVCQELRQKLLMGDDPLALRFTGQRPLRVWLRVVAQRLAIDRHRAQEPGDDAGFENLWTTPDPELDAIKLIDAPALRGVLHDSMQSLPPRSRSLLRLHYLEGVSLERLALIEQVHRATVARWLADARSEALSRVHALLAERFALDEAEGKSLLRLVRSRLELSFRRALERSSPPPR